MVATVETTTICIEQLPETLTCLTVETPFWFCFEWKISPFCFFFINVDFFQVTFDIDANGILTVSAKEQATGKQNNITISNDKGRLTKQQIDEMVTAAEKYKEQDREIRAAVAARNELESYVYQMRQLIKEPTTSSRIASQEKQAMTEACNMADDWLSNTDKASEREYVEKKEEVEKVCRPVVVRLYSGPPPSQRQFPSANDNEDGGPIIDEVDWLR